MGSRVSRIGQNSSSRTAPHLKLAPLHIVPADQTAPPINVLAGKSSPQKGLNAAEHQRAVGAPEAEIILQRHVDLHFPGRVGAIVQIALGIQLEDVDSWR